MRLFASSITFHLTLLASPSLQPLNAINSTRSPLPFELLAPCATRLDIHSSVPGFVMFREELREFGFGDRSNLGL
jgi:hypothetical protein